jgi:hypothetical protein
MYSFLNLTGLLTNKTISEPEMEQPELQPQPQTQYSSIIKNVLLTPGRHISFPILQKKGLFRKPVNGESGKFLARIVGNELQQTDLGEIETFTNPGNKSQVRQQ